MTLFLIGIGGFVGAICRYLVDTQVSARIGAAFPLGTLVVNLTGAFILGLLYALAIEREVLPADIREPILIGVIGAYTTFSTLMLESWRLIETGQVVSAAANIGGSVVLGMLAVVAGLMIGRAG